MARPGADRAEGNTGKTFTILETKQSLPTRHGPPPPRPLPSQYTLHFLSHLQGARWRVASWEASRQALIRFHNGVILHPRSLPLLHTMLHPEPQQHNLSDPCPLANPTLVCVRARCIFSRLPLTLHSPLAVAQHGSPTRRSAEGSEEEAALAKKR